MDGNEGEEADDSSSSTVLDSGEVGEEGVGDDKLVSIDGTDDEAADEVRDKDFDSCFESPLMAFFHFETKPLAKLTTFSSENFRNLPHKTPISVF
jgi:hypothetical protein